MNEMTKRYLETIYKPEDVDRLVVYLGCLSQSDRIAEICSIFDSVKGYSHTKMWQQFFLSKEVVELLPEDLRLEMVQYRLTNSQFPKFKKDANELLPLLSAEDMVVCVEAMIESSPYTKLEEHVWLHKQIDKSLPINYLADELSESLSAGEMKTARLAARCLGRRLHQSEYIKLLVSLDERKQVKKMLAIIPILSSKANRKIWQNKVLQICISEVEVEYVDDLLVSLDRGLYVDESGMYFQVLSLKNQKKWSAVECHCKARVPQLQVESALDHAFLQFSKISSSSDLIKIIEVVEQYLTNYRKKKDYHFQAYHLSIDYACVDAYESVMGIRKIDPKFDDLYQMTVICIKEGWYGKLNAVITYHEKHFPDIPLNVCLSNLEKGIDTENNRDYDSDC